ncbi:hypothetical protein ACWCPS_17035 [Streptomyces mauvecolor]
MSGRSLRTAFQPVIDQTHCPFARVTHWVYSDPADEGLALGGHLERALPLLRGAMREVAEDDADGFVLELPGRLGADVTLLRESSLTALSWLAERSDPPCEVRMADLEDPAWWFPFDGERLFTVAFGECFAAAHTRYSFGAKGLFLVFQHESAFSRRYPEGIPAALRDRIRTAFEEAGRPYRYDMGVVPALRTGKGDE